MERLLDTATTFLTLLTELVVLFLLVSFAVTLLTRWIGLDRVGRWMGGGSLLGALKGIGLGFATPFCTYSAIPMLVGLRQAKVRISTTVGFLLAAPILDPLLFAAFAVLFSPAMALSYTAITFAGVLAVALLADASGMDEFRSIEAVHVAQSESAAACTSTSVKKCGSTEHSAPDGPACGLAGADHPGATPSEDPAWQGWHRETRKAGHAAIELTCGMAGHIVGAVLVAALVIGYVPEGLLLNVAGPERLFAIPAAALIGVPFYISVEALAPVGAALAAKGMSVGAVFALTVAGAGVNIPEFALLSKIMTTRGMVALVGAVFGVAVLGGYLMQML